MTAFYRDSQDRGSLCWIPSWLCVQAPLDAFQKILIRNRPFNMHVPAKMPTFPALILQAALRAEAEVKSCRRAWRLLSGPSLLLRWALVLISLWCRTKSISAFAVPQELARRPQRKEGASCEMMSTNVPMCIRSRKLQGPKACRPPAAASQRPFRTGSKPSDPPNQPRLGLGQQHVAFSQLYWRFEATWWIRCAAGADQQSKKQLLLWRDHHCLKQLLLRL